MPIDNDNSELTEKAQKLIELGKLLADKSKTLREALTEMTVRTQPDLQRGAPFSKPKRRSR